MQYLQLLEKDIIEYFFVDLDNVGREWKLLTVAGYFTKIAEELTKLYDTEIRPAQKELKELKQYLEKYKEDIAKKASYIAYAIIPILSVIVDIITAKMIIVLGTVVVNLILHLVEQVRNITVNKLTHFIGKSIAKLIVRLRRRDLIFEVRFRERYIEYQRSKVISLLKMHIRRTIMSELSSEEL